jgi:putative ABC transport system permease protein
MRYIPLMLKNALRNRRRSLLTIFSIGASLCLLGVLFAIYRALYLAPPIPGQELRLITHHKVSITQGMPSAYAEKIRHVPGVRDAMIWQWFGGTYKDSRNSANFFARFAVEPDRFFNVRPEINMDEDQKTAFKKQRTGAIASDDLVKQMGWKLGERILLVGDIFPVNPELTLVGTFNDPATTQTLFFSREYLRELQKAKNPNGNADWVGMFQVQAESADAVPRVARDIDALFAGASEATKTESEKAFVLQFAAFLGNVKLYLMSICGAVTFTILLVSANTMAMAVRERAREVGILKTLGYGPDAILFMILAEAGLIAFVGGVVGLALASGMVRGVRSALSVVGLSTLAITPDVAAVSLGLALFIGVASSFVPAWSAARTPILESLKSAA